MACIPPTSVRYYFGRISRDEAEHILLERGADEGLHLLRESSGNNYALSICHNKQVFHYSIVRQAEGAVMIHSGRKFPGPVELVQHHAEKLDGFITQPLVPCERRPDQHAMAWPGVTMMELEQKLIEEATSMGLNGDQLANALGPQRQQFILRVVKEIHVDQPWFHNNISRDEAEKAITLDGHVDGKFLVRERDDKGYALSLSFFKQVRHYKIQKHKLSECSKYAIEDGPMFDALIEVISHYHARVDGLLCRLTCPCVRSGYIKKTASQVLSSLESNSVYGVSIPICEKQRGTSEVPIPLPNRSSKTNDFRSSTEGASSRSSTWIDPVLHKQGIISDENVSNAIWDDPDIPEMPAPILPHVVHAQVDSQKIYDSVPRTDDVFNLDKSNLEMSDKLGAGNFGSVMRGSLRRDGQAIPVAIKTLKCADIASAQAGLMKEARVMAGLQHKHIVRLIGMCTAEAFMLVMELAPLGQLNKYLKIHPKLSPKTVLRLCFQVSEAMAYLESNNFVHRDLAARNVLLVNDHFAKVSDFGMSKALGLDDNYYKAETVGKWPLKWYAPECIYYYRFDSKSDVWSYGVMLWEAISYGAKPYKGLKGNQILDRIENGMRLEMPEACPPEVYDLMKQCWTFESETRPSFQDIAKQMRIYR